MKPDFKRLIRLLTIVCLFLTLPRFALPQVTKLDSFGDVGYELLLSRLDFLASEVHQSNGVGFVVIHPGTSILDAVAYGRAVNLYAAFRNFPVGYVSVVWAEATGDEVQIELWKAPQGQTAPVTAVPLNYSLPHIRGKTLMVDTSLEVFHDEGKLFYGTGENLVNPFRVDALSRILAANPGLAAEIRIFNRSTRAALTLVRLIRSDATSSGIPSRKLKIVYGTSGQTLGWSKEVSAVQLWLLPQEAKRIRANDKKRGTAKFD